MKGLLVIGSVLLIAFGLHGYKYYDSRSTEVTRTDGNLTVKAYGLNAEVRGDVVADAAIAVMKRTGGFSGEFVASMHSQSQIMHPQKSELTLCVARICAKASGKELGLKPDQYPAFEAVLRRVKEKWVAKDTFIQSW